MLFALLVELFEGGTLTGIWLEAAVYDVWYGEWEFYD